MYYGNLGWQEAVVLGCAKREKILDSVADGSRSAEEVANRLGMSSRAMYALRSALAELGVLAEEKNKFRLLEEHRGPLLDRSHPDYAGGLVAHRFKLIRKWGRMPEILKTGTPIEDEQAQGPEGKETFIYSMRRLAKPGVRARGARPPVKVRGLLGHVHPPGVHGCLPERAASLSLPRLGFRSVQRGSGPLRPSPRCRGYR